MVKKLLITLFLSFCSLAINSQEKNVFIEGQIIDSVGVVKNVNIINLNTKQGTSSNDNGMFSIIVKLGDSIRLSSVQHIPKILIINKYNIENQPIVIKLNLNTFELDEFELKRNNLSGNLGIDAINAPRNKKDSLLNKLLDFSEMDLSKFSFPTDEMDRMKPPIVNTVPNSLAGAGGSATIPFKDHESILRKKLAQKKAVPDKIISELGEQFFYEELKIPKDKYFHFLEYCNPLGIENLHKENKIFELIEIFRKESISYLKIINQD